MSSFLPENSYRHTCLCGADFLAPKGSSHCHKCLYGRIAELEKELEKEVIRKKESYRAEERLEEENRELRRRVFRSYDGEEYWIFSDDGEDFVHSLVCPVVMSADKLRELVKASTSGLLTHYKEGAL